MKKFKNSINIFSMCPNNIIIYKGIYGFKNIWKIQIEVFLNTFTNRLNNIGPVRIFTNIRLKEAQIINWKPTNIISNKPILFITKGNLQASTLLLAHKLKITYKGSALISLFD